MDLVKIIKQIGAWLFQKNTALSVEAAFQLRSTGALENLQGLTWISIRQALKLGAQKKSQDMRFPLDAIY